MLLRKLLEDVNAAPCEIIFLFCEGHLKLELQVHITFLKDFDHFFLHDITATIDGYVSKAFRTKRMQSGRLCSPFFHV